MRKISCILIFFLLSLAMHGQGSWELLEVPTQNHLRSVFFTDSLYGWAVGDTGTIMHTHDGGESWILQDAGTQNNIMNVFFLNRDTGWAASWNFDGFYGTLLLKTTDGGMNWDHLPYPDENIFINCILFLDPLTGWMGGSPHALVKTTDGGNTWAQAAIDTNALAFFPVLNVYFYDELHGYACGGMFDIAGVTWSTSDGGNLWHPILAEEAPADEVHGMHLFGPGEVIGAGGDPDQGYGVAMIRTNNGGANWEYEELSMPGNAFDIDFRTPTQAWAPLGPQQKLIYSLDAGNSWTQTDSPGNTAIFDMIFTDSLHGYGLGYNGAFIRYKPVGVGLTEAQSTTAEINIFPNPANDMVFVTISGKRGGAGPMSQGEIGIYNLQYQVLQCTKFKIEGRGKTVLQLDVSGLESGVHIIKVSQGEHSNVFTQKLLIR